MIDRWPELRTMKDVNVAYKRILMAWERCSVCNNQFPSSEIINQICVTCRSFMPTERELKSLRNDVKAYAKKYGRELNKEITDLLVMRLLGKRTNRIIKERIKHESNHTDVYGQQQPDEENHEGRI